MIEPQPEMEDMEEDVEEVSSRQPVLINDGEFFMDQKLLHGKLNMQVPIYAHIESAWVIDPKPRTVYGVCRHQLHAQELERQRQVARTSFGDDARLILAEEKVRRSRKLG